MLGVWECGLGVLCVGELCVCVCVRERERKRERERERGGGVESEKAGEEMDTRHPSNISTLFVDKRE